MDVLLWPNVERTISGVKNGAHFLDSYTPSKNLVDRPGLRVDYGFGVGGYQGFLMHLQAGEAGYMSRRRVMESMPGVTDTAEEQNLIDLEAMDDAGKALFQQQAATGALDMRIWAKLRKEMAEKGTPLYEAIEKYQAELAAQAMAAAQQGDTGPALTVPGEEDMPPQEELPGIPPSVLAGV
jgi:hypothetical protein